MKKPTGAATFNGVWGNIKLMFWTKLWATLIIFGGGILVGGYFACGYIAGWTT